MRNDYAIPYDDPEAIADLTAMLPRTYPGRRPNGIGRYTSRWDRRKAARVLVAVSAGRTLEWCSRQLWGVPTPTWSRWVGGFPDLAERYAHAKRMPRLMREMAEHDRLMDVVNAARDAAHGQRR